MRICKFKISSFILIPVFNHNAAALKINDFISSDFLDLHPDEKTQSRFYPFHFPEQLLN